VSCGDEALQTASAATVPKVGKVHSDIIMQKDYDVYLAIIHLQHMSKQLHRTIPSQESSPLLIFKVLRIRTS